MGGSKGSSKGSGKGTSSSAGKGSSTKGRTSTAVSKPVTKEVHKPWVKQDSSKSGKWDKGDRNGSDKWSSRTTSKGDRNTRDRDNWSSRGSKGKGKGGKGKRFVKAAPLSSKFWERKEENENRQPIGEETYAGVISRYNIKQGWGFIMPDFPNDLPQEVKDALQEAVKTAEAEGKEVADPNHLYFRKPDVNHADGFKLAKEAPVTFSVYVDDKGAGACDVSMA